MKDIKNILSQLEKLNIKLWVEEERLLYSAPTGAMTPEIRQTIKENKPEIITLLTEKNQTAQQNTMDKNTDIQAQIANLSPEKKESLLRRLAEKQLTQENKIVRNNGCNSYPASFTQTRFWFLNQLEPDSPVYNMFKALKFTQELNIENLKQALNQIITRHETLRTTFRSEKGELKQIIAEKWSLELPTINLADYPEEVDLPTPNPSQDGKNEEKTFEKLATEIIQKPFNLAQDLMLRATLFRLENNEYILLLVNHHIISDGWSSQIIIKELLTCYENIQKRATNTLPELPIQYGDFAIWQKKQFEQGLYKKQLKYWKEKLSGQLPILNLPTDKKRPLIPSYQGKSIAFFLPNELEKNLNKLSQQEKVTLSMLLLAAFKVFLYRYTGQEDIIIGSPIAGRQKLETENLIGCFLNTLALRNQLNSNFTFRELLQQVKQVSLEAYENQDLPFEKLIEELQPDRNLSQSPIFQVMFNFLNTPEYASINCPSFKERINIEQNRALFDLTLYVRQKQARSQIAFQYSTDLFESATIERMTRHFQILLAGIVNNPDEKISHLPLLTQAEKQQILIDWNNTKTDYPKDKCIHQLFEEQVAKTPDKIAVVFEEQQLTYSQLNEKANQLAHYLQKLGVKPETLVGICVERSLEMIIGILGILKAGGAYVPLDPNYPSDRLMYMLDNAQISVLLTAENLQAKLASYTGKIVCTDREWDKIEQESKENLKTAVCSKNLAYVIYTSGSTGNPKGVLVKHNSVNRLVKNTNYINIHPSAKIAQIANTSFDAATFEIWGALLNGAKLVIFSKETTLQLELFIEQLKEKELDTIFITTALFNQIANIYPQAFNTLKYVLFGGEKVEPKWVKEIIEKGKPENLIHVYGPTENTTFSTWYSVNNLAENADNLPIGKPISNTKIYILDTNLQPTPIGVVGELHIAGDGVARGYLNRPELTAEKFIDHPFGAGKLYKTGDLARYLPDGNIEFIGRIDNQVKIRGYRIELGEIEANLLEHPNIEEALVIIQEKEQEKYLVAYIVPTQEEVPSIENIRQFLQQRLPEYMIPSAYVPLEAFPLTPNGKIDRKALPSPDRKHIIEQEFIPPQTATEKKLARIWQKVLWKEEEIGVNDNFFDLGGHSLLSVKLVAEIEQEFKQKLPLKALFQLSTIKELAAILDQEKYTKELPSQIEINESKKPLDSEIYHQLLAYTSGWKGKRINPQSLIFGHNLKGHKQPLFWVLQGYRELSQLAKYIGEEQPVYGMRSGHLIIKYTQENLKALATYYVNEILTVQPEGPYLIGGNCQSATIATEIALQLISKSKTITLLSLLENQKPQRYPGKVALFYGRDSRFNPYKHFLNPEIGWRKLYPLGFSVDLIPCDHGQYFDEPNINIFAEKLRSAIELAQTESPEQLLPETAYQAEIITTNSLRIEAGQKHLISVTVKNISSVTWLASDKSGIMLGNHWLDKNGEIIQWADGRTPLSHLIQSGATAKLNLLITIPEKPGEYQLELDLVEEGITWFKNKGSQTSLVNVEVLEIAEKINTEKGDNEIREKQDFTLDIYRKQGDAAFEKGDFETALINYQKAIKLNRQQPIEVYQNLGDVLTQQQQLLAALTAYQKVIEQAQETDSICFRIGKVYHQLQQWVLAVSYYQKAIKIKEEQPFELFQKLGEAQEKLEDLNAAIAAYQKAIEIQQDYPNIYIALARCLSKNDNKVDLPTPNPSQEGKEAAIKHWEKVIELSPDNLGAYLNIGNLLTQIAEFEKAHKVYDSALKMSENNAQVYVNLGNLYRQEKDFDQAIAAYSKALEIDKKHGGARLHLVTLLYQQQRYSEALEICLESVKIDPENPHFYRQLGNIQRQIGELETAISSYDKAIKLEQNCYYTYIIQGETLRQLGKFEQAIATYQQAQKLEPEKPRAYLSLGNAYLQQGDVLKAIESYQKAIEIEQKQPFMVYKNLGDALNKQGKKEEAIDAYSSALKLQPENVNLRKILSNLQGRKETEK